MPVGLRRASALLAIVALAVGGAKVVDDHTLPGSGFSAVATVAAEPTGPPGPTGGMTDGGGSQFQPPQMPSSMPDYQGGNNQPPLNQDSGVSIYNSGNPQAPQQVPGQQAGQQPQQAQQPAHGTQIPDYQSNPGYTQGPGQPNPNYQAPQQQSPQQGQQPQQQQPNQQQPQNKQDDTTQQLDQKKQQCQAAAVQLATDAGTAGPVVLGGGGRSPIWWFEPGLDPTPTPTPPCPQGGDCAQKPPPLTPEQIQQVTNDPAMRQYIQDQIKKGIDEQVPKKVEEAILEEKRKPPVLDSLFAALAGCPIGAGAGAVLGAAPGAAIGCITGIITGGATPWAVWGLNMSVPKTWVLGK